MLAAMEHVQSRARLGLLIGQKATKSNSFGLCNKSTLTSQSEVCRFQQTNLGLLEVLKSLLLWPDYGVTSDFTPSTCFVPIDPIRQHRHA